MIGNLISRLDDPSVEGFLGKEGGEGGEGGKERKKELRDRHLPFPWSVGSEAVSHLPLSPSPPPFPLQQRC